MGSQRPALDLPLTVARLLELGQLRTGPEHSQMSEAIDRFGLLSFLEQPICSLSVGQAQRAHLGRMWAQRDPRGVLVLDEPTAALDHQWAAQTLDALAFHSSNGGAVVVSIHDLAVAAHRADRVWLLKGGGLVAEGPPSTVFELGQLESVFGSMFEWVERSDGSHWLVQGASQSE